MPVCCKTLLVALCVGLSISVSPVFAEPLVFLDQQAFLDALATMGYAAVHEGFENDAKWGDVRSTILGGNSSAPSVVSKGLTWSANNLSSQITTSSGAARRGDWGFYSFPHGSYTQPDPGANCLAPGECGDGWRGVAVDNELVAIGGWVSTNTPYAGLGLYLDVYPNREVDFGETCSPPDSENCVSNNVLGSGFFGVIDTVGFSRFEYRELEGKLEIDGGDIKYIFSDDFWFSFRNTDLIMKDGFE